MPRPSASAPMIIASTRPISWIQWAPKMPPALATRASRTEVARQCTMHSPDSPMAKRSRREVEIVADVMAKDITSQLPRDNITSGIFAGALAIARLGVIGAAMDSALTSPLAQDDARPPRPLLIARWLLLVAILVFAIVVVGGITRLTESGLSITQWNLVGGTLPPLSQADWLAEFALYQATPEYREINGPAGMGLAAFKQIYFWEWLHRLLGRMIGLAMFV